MSTILGPGTLTVGNPGTDVSCEVLGGRITHEYEEVTARRTPLCGNEKPAARKRNDGLTFTLENDLTATGLYSWLLANDLTTQPFVFTPNTADGASWSGSFLATLPADVGADEFGAPLGSTVTWDGVGAFTFTPIAAPA